jgi:hypothetical protein
VHSQIVRESPSQNNTTQIQNDRIRKITILQIFFMGLDLNSGLQACKAGTTTWDTPPVHFALVILEMGVSQTICPGWPQTLILQISASQVVRWQVWATSIWLHFTNLDEKTGLGKDYWLGTCTTRWKVGKQNILTLPKNQYTTYVNVKVRKNDLYVGTIWWLLFQLNDQMSRHWQWANLILRLLMIQNEMHS